MKNIKKMTGRRIYNHPKMVCIELDNEISLALESTPPIGPDETRQVIDYNQNSPFHINHT